MTSSLVVPLLVVHPEFEKPVFEQPVGEPVELLENSDLDPYVTTVRAFDNVGERLRYFIVDG